MSLTLVLFLIGILGFVFNRKNIILMLISIEIMLLSITFLILVSSINLDDIIGQTYAIYIIVVAGAESAIGLAILVAFYRLSSLKFNHLSFSYAKASKLPAVNLINRTPVGIRNYSTVCSDCKNNSIDPWFITGLFDAESSFVVTILKNPRYKTGWNVQARVQIKMHERDRDLMTQIKKFFGGIGYISNPNKNTTVEFRVSTINDIVNVIIPHFDNYPLLTKKYSDYVLFKNIIKLMLKKNHSTLEGIQKIVNIKASMNLGLSDGLKNAFPETMPVVKEANDIKDIPQEWMAGFSTGESNFFITIQNSKTKSGIAASLRFSIAQDSKDLSLLESFENFFGCGYVAKYKNRSVCEFIVTKIDHIVNNIIPFFDKHSIRGSKYPDFLNFKSAALIIKNKEHLKEEGLKQILQLKNKTTVQVNTETKNNHGHN
uniref:NADH dehydrogenase subunit 4L n=1 Tax=Trichoderma asperellum TaxID=101201 RepID=A0A0G3ITB6_TRIAP|nr:NADH dehydrogenase subunit 4L [Trichoderma asperellum]AKK32425.1 NADH dehydrogenase subunit 4L [Trichoderma asperellum]